MVRTRGRCQRRRRTPIVEVEKAIDAFKAKTGADADAKLLSAFAVAFGQLTAERSQVTDGLTGLGRKQREMAEGILEENETAQQAANDDAFARLQWDIRVFEDRRRTVSYVCETPVLIESRIGAIAQAVKAVL